MGLFEHFPYTNFHELNLGWIIDEIKRLDKRMDDLPEEVKAEIAPEVVSWIEQYITDAGIYVAGEKLVISPVGGGVLDGYVKQIQYGADLYNIHDTEAHMELLSIGNRLDTVEGDITQINGDITDLKNWQPVGGVSTFKDCRFYVDSANGDDTDIGTHSDHPFKTLDRAFEEFTKYPAIWVYLLDADGVFDVWNYGIYSGRTLHITAEADNCWIVFHDPDDLPNGIPVYNSHWNLQARNSAHTLHVQCFEQELATPSHLYFDNTFLSLKNVAFEDYVGFYGSTLDADHCTFKYINFEQGEISFKNGTTFTNKDPDQYLLRCFNSVANLIGTFTTDSLTSAGTSAPAYMFRHTDAYIGSRIVSSQVNNYYQAMDVGTGSKVTISTARLADIDSYCVTASTASDGGDINTY